MTNISEQQPNDPLDHLTVEVERLRKENHQLSLRMHKTEKAMVELLRTLQVSEETFELRASRVLHTFFHGLTESLEQSIQAGQQAYRLKKQGFDIKLVDGIEEKEGPESIIVTKKEDGSFDYAKSAAPEIIVNTGTERFSQYLSQHDEMFEGGNQILVNIYAYQEKPMEPSSEQATTTG